MLELDGASLFFASQRNPQSLQTLQHYIRHRLFSSHYVPDKSLSHPTFKMAFNLPPEPQYIDPASLCVPVGWDNVSKIQGVCETFDGCKFVNNSYPSANDTLLGSAKREYAMNLGPKPDPPVVGVNFICYYDADI